MASNVSAAASKAAASKPLKEQKDEVKLNTVVCDSCGNECHETSSFCTKCGHSLEEAKKAKEATSSYVDEAAKFAREMASNESDATETATEEVSSKVENNADDTTSNGVSLSK